MSLSSENGKVVHPLGLEPLGAALLKGSSNKGRERGLGLLNIFSDERIIFILKLLNPKKLVQLQSVSKVLYAFTRHEEIWRDLFSLEHESLRPFVICQTWRETFLYSKFPNFHRNSLNSGFLLKDFYSDVLFYSWYCLRMQPLPSWLQISNVDFRSNITKEQFLEHYESKGLPVVLTDVVTTWSAYRTWTKEYLMTLCGNRLFTAGSVSLSLADFFKISETIGDNSLYIFDKRFGEKVTELVADYVVPDYFSEDLFSVLGKNRPDYRWLVIGGRYSGSTFHIDPIATSAWNAVIRGKKKWILFPPGTVPPGVIPSEDLDSVATPESVLECCKNLERKPLECVVSAGELIYIPSGWWHVVLNLEESVAVTQNYVSFSILTKVLKFLKNKKGQITGCGSKETADTLFERFSKALKEKFPTNSQVISSLQQCSTSFWELLTLNSHKSFAFQFGDN